MWDIDPNLKDDEIYNTLSEIIYHIAREIKLVQLNITSNDINIVDIANNYLYSIGYSNIYKKEKEEDISELFKKQYMFTVQFNYLESMFIEIDYHLYVNNSEVMETIINKHYQNMVSLISDILLNLSLKSDLKIEEQFIEQIYKVYGNNLILPCEVLTKKSNCDIIGNRNKKKSIKSFCSGLVNSITDIKTFK